jgi:hypothetical protein
MTGFWRLTRHFILRYTCGISRQRSIDMPITFDHAQTSIAQLVRHFHTNLALYRAPTYKEAQARQEFIDKMFVYLGWDVYNIVEGG